MWRVWPLLRLLVVGCCYDYKPKLYVKHFLSKMTCFYINCFPCLIQNSELERLNSLIHCVVRAKMDLVEMLNVELKSNFWIINVTPFLFFSSNRSASWWIWVYRRKGHLHRFWKHLVSFLHLLALCHIHFTKPIQYGEAILNFFSLMIGTPVDPRG